MSEKKFSDFENPMDAIVALTQMMGSGNSLGHFFGGLFEDPKEKYPYERLGDGYELRPIELTEKQKEDKHLVNMKYSHLYHNDLKISDKIFRKGGLGGTFKDGYCSLIHYIRSKEAKKNNSGFSFGTHVIINQLGDIALEGDTLDYPYHISGHLASKKETIYDLRTGKAIAPKSSTSIRGINSVIIEHRYDWYGKDLGLPLGIYKIDYWTAEITKIDDVK